MHRTKILFLFEIVPKEFAVLPKEFSSKPALIAVTNPDSNLTILDNPVLNLDILFGIRNIVIDKKCKLSR
jgi:hypothetical protein